MNGQELFTRALMLAIAAPDDLKSQEAVELAEDFAAQFTLSSEVIERCKADALAQLKLEEQV